MLVIVVVHTHHGQVHIIPVHSRACSLRVAAPELVQNRPQSRYGRLGHLGKFWVGISFWVLRLRRWTSAGIPGVGRAAVAVREFIPDAPRSYVESFRHALEQYKGHRYAAAQNTYVDLRDTKGC